jgi:hypothetical protein
MAGPQDQHSSVLSCNLVLVNDQRLDIMTLFTAGLTEGHFGLLLQLSSGLIPIFSQRNAAIFAMHRKMLVNASLMFL